MSGVLKGVGGVAKKVGGLASNINPVVGAGLGVLGGILARPGEDPRLAARNDLMNQIQGFGPPQVAGLDPREQEAFGLFQQYAQQGLENANAPLANRLELAQQYQNPFEQQVIQGVQSDFDRQRLMARRQAEDTAMREGAFGGNRAGLFASSALGGLARQEAGQLANLRYGGFQSALDAANQDIGNELARRQLAAQGSLVGLNAATLLGQGGATARGIEQYGFDAPFNRALQVGGLINQQADIPGRPSLFQSALGGGLTGYGLFRKNPQTGTQAAPSTGATPAGYRPPGFFQPQRDPLPFGGFRRP